MHAMLPSLLNPRVGNQWRKVSDAHSTDEQKSGRE